MFPSVGFAPGKLKEEAMEPPWLDTAFERSWGETALCLLRAFI